MPKCNFCELPSVYDLPVCEHHRSCTECNGICTLAELVTCIRNQDLPVHAKCMVLRTVKVSDQDVRISRKYFDYLNLCRLLIEPDEKLSKDTNAHTSRVMTTNWIIDMSLESKFLAMSKLEAVAAELSVLLKKDKRAIEIELSERDKQKFEDARKKAKEPAPKKGTSSKEAKSGVELALSSEDKKIAKMRKSMPWMSIDQCRELLTKGDKVQ